VEFHFSGKEDGIMRVAVQIELLDAERVALGKLRPTSHSFGRISYSKD
jgi:hypothetical protein